MSRTALDDYGLKVLYPATSITGNVTGNSVDYLVGKGYGQQAVVIITVGPITGAPTSVDLTLEESSDGTTWDTAKTSSPTAAGVTSFELPRMKKYIRLKAGFTGGTTPSATISASLMLLRTSHGPGNSVT